MKKTVTTCDKCGAVIPNNEENTITIPTSFDKSYLYKKIDIDLCAPHFIELTKWLGIKQKVD